jgi:hypothetical protein
MGAICNAYTHPHHHRPPQGKGEVREVLRYRGNGWYQVRCVLVDDPTRSERVLWMDIDEDKKQEGGAPKR